MHALKKQEEEKRKKKKKKSENAKNGLIIISLDISSQALHGLVLNTSQYTDNVDKWWQ